MPTAPSRNRLLSRLPAAELHRLKPRLELVELRLHADLPGAGAPLEHVHFILQGQVSLFRSLEDGSTVEVGLVGREGLVGIEAILGASRCMMEKLVQVPGSALRISSRGFREELARSPALKAQMDRHVQAVLIHASQNAACNGRHALQERLARRLLMAHDRVEADTIPLSHEVLATTLGARRPGVTTILGSFRRAGLIGSGPGKITILDRLGLESVACECYDAVENEVGHLFAPGR